MLSTMKPGCVQAWFNSNQGSRWVSTHKPVASWSQSEANYSQSLDNAGCELYSMVVDNEHMTTVNKICVCKHQIPLMWRQKFFTVIFTHAILKTTTSCRNPWHPSTIFSCMKTPWTVIFIPKCPYCTYKQKISEAMELTSGVCYMRTSLVLSLQYPKR